MYNIYYIGAQNSERIDFCQWPYMVTGGNLFDGEFDAIEDDDRIQGWERKITSKKLNIEIHAVGVSLEQAIDQLENVAEKDVLNTSVHSQIRNVSSCLEAVQLSGTRL